MPGSSSSDPASLMGFKCAECGAPCDTGVSTRTRDERVVVVPSCVEHLAPSCRVSARCIVSLRRMDTESARQLVRDAGFAATFHDQRAAVSAVAEVDNA